MVTKDCVKPGIQSGNFKLMEKDLSVQSPEIEKKNGVIIENAEKITSTKSSKNKKKKKSKSNKATVNVSSTNSVTKINDVVVENVISENGKKPITSDIEKEKMENLNDLISKLSKSTDLQFLFDKVSICKIMFSGSQSSQ